jgi:hypothetical protein
LENRLIAGNIHFLDLQIILTADDPCIKHLADEEHDCAEVHLAELFRLFLGFLYDALPAVLTVTAIWLLRDGLPWLDVMPSAIRLYGTLTKPHRSGNIGMSRTLTLHFEDCLFLCVRHIDHPDFDISVASIGKSVIISVGHLYEWDKFLYSYICFLSAAKIE